MKRAYSSFMGCNRCAAGLVAVLVLLQGAVAVWAEPVREIRVESRDRHPVDDAVVKGYLSIKEGDEVSRDALSRDVRAMERSGRFSYVAADLKQDVEGLTVIYTVELKPRIRRLMVDGADYLGNRKVRELLEIGVGDPVDDAILANRSRAVKEAYEKKHYPFVDLSWTISVEPATRSADVTVIVDEGVRAKVADIEFAGNENISSSRLRKVMQQKKVGLFSWMTGSGTYKPDDLAADVVALRRLYLGEGYLDVRVGDPEIIQKKTGRISVQIKIDEGSRYQMGQYSLSGVTLFEEAALRAVVTNRPGDIASTDALQSMSRNLRDYYGSRGYIDTSVSYKLDPRAGATGGEGLSSVVDVAVTVREGHLARVRDVRFRGNTTTKDKVLRREVTVYPGDVMNEVKLRNSENRLRNLGYFSSVIASEEPTPDPALYDAVFDLEEQKTGQFIVGAGFSSIDKLIGFIELQQGNFDMGSWPPVGGGQKLRLRGTLGTERSDMELSLTEPWFLDRRLSLGGTLFRRDSRFLSDEYKQRNTGGNISLGWPASRFVRVSLTYGLEEISVYDVDEEASDLIRAEEGDRVKSSFTTEVTYDTRDNFFIPTRGTRASVSAMVAGGPLGGETDIYRSDVMASKFWPLWFDHVFNLRFWIAGVEAYGDSDQVPIFDRLFLGGARTLRGFDYRDVGPKDEDGEPIGGSSMWYASAEYTVPIVRSIRVAAFYDMGMVYNDAFDWDWGEYNSDVGLGVRFDIPGFPLRFDYSWPLETDESNDRDSGRFQFSIGYSF